MNMPQKVRDYLGYFFIEKKDISKSCFMKKLCISNSLFAYFNQKEN